MEEKKFDVKKEEVAVKKEVKLQKSCKVDDLYYFKSEKLYEYYYFIVIGNFCRQIFLFS